MKHSVGIIGLGAIFDSHAQALRLRDDLDITDLCDADEEVLGRRTQEWKCRGHTNYRELLAEPPDVIVVALPHGSHCEVAVAALEAGAHVVVEKPMAVGVGECRRMLAAARDAGRVLLVSETAAHHPGVRRTGEKFRNGELGRFLSGAVLNVRFYFHEGRPAWFLDPAFSGGGMFGNVGLHRLAAARACLPGLDPRSVTAEVARIAGHPVEACTSAMVRYAGGGAMHYEEIGYFPKPDWWQGGSHFVFEEGMVAFDNRTWRLVTRDGKEYTEQIAHPASAYAPVYADLLRALAGEPPEGLTALDCARDTAIVHAAYASSAEGREIDLGCDDWRVDGVWNTGRLE